MSTPSGAKHDRASTDKRLYSVPNALVGVKLDVRITDTSVEVMHKGQRVSLHPRHAPIPNMATGPAWGC